MRPILPSIPALVLLPAFFAGCGATEDPSGSAASSRPEPSPTAVAGNSRVPVSSTPWDEDMDLSVTIHDASPVEGAGHLLRHERPEEVAELVPPFLRGE